ncbi:MAG: hypothetical protein H6R13_1334 [Proteobacteria bacterium]|nr:hypothetical protein [Pseudomonadota bacterium]
MTTKSSLVFALVFASANLSVATHAETFQWKDSNGQTVVSDVPPPASAKGRRSIGGQQPAVVSEKVAEKSPEGTKATDAPMTTAEKDLEFKKRQQEAKEKAEKQAKEQAAEKDKRDNCDNARRNLAALETNQPMATYDDKGQRILMDGAQREQTMERARRVVADSCK